jgi:hypothetical protein
MEYRDDLERLLLAGLTELEQEETAQSMANATASKLSRLRSTGVDDDPADTRTEADEPEENQA